MARSTWQGKLWVSALMGVDVQMFKATQDYEGDEGFREVCECHGLPFKRTQVCVGGKRRLTEALVKAGDVADTTPMVKAVQRGDDYVVVPGDQIKAINASLTDKTLRTEYRVPMDEAPTEQITESYFVCAAPGNEPGLAAIHEALAETGEALVGTWTARSVPRLVLIHPVGDTLRMSVVRYAAEWVTPDANAKAHRAVKLSVAERNAAVQMIGLVDGKAPNWSSFESDAVKARQSVIGAVLAGKPVPAKAEPVAAAPAAGSLMDQLNAALAAAGGAKPKAPAKRKAAPAARAPRRTTK